LDILLHSLLSVFALSILGIAALQAVFLAVQGHILHDKHRLTLIRRLPPLETMERFLFQLIWLGFALLTCIVFTSLLFFHDVFEPHMLQKTLLSIVAWLVFALLLFGRNYFGWRGIIAVRWTLVGVLLLMIVFLMSWLRYS